MLAGNVSEAEFLYKLLMELGNKPEYDACGSLISLYGKQQKLKEAKEVFAEVADSCGTCTILYNSMVDAYIKCNRQEDAYMFFKEVIEGGHSLGPVAISMLVNALINCGKNIISQTEFLLLHDLQRLEKVYIVVVCSDIRSL